MSQAPGISQMIQQINEQEKIVLEENKRLKQLQAIQDDLIAKQRQALLEVAQTANELLEVEEKRRQLKAKLQSQKTKLLIAASEAAEASPIIATQINGESQLPISAGQTGVEALKAVDEIQKRLYFVTEQCLKTEELSAPPESVKELVCGVNEVIQKIIDTGAAKESTEDTVRRQSYVIESLVPAPEEEE